MGKVNGGAVEREIAFTDATQSPVDGFFDEVSRVCCVCGDEGKGTDEAIIRRFLIMGGSGSSSAH